MSEFWLNFHFLRPWLLILLLLPAALYFLQKKEYGNVSSWESVCDKDLLPYLLIKGSNHRRRNIFRLILLGFVCAIIAAAGPSYRQKEIPPLYQQNPVMISINISTDMESNDIKPSRLSRAKYLISDLIKMLPNSQIGLEAYSSEPFEIVPVSEDAAIIENILPAVEYDIMPENGNRIDRAIEFAVSGLQNAGFGFGNIVIVASDGGSNVSNAIKVAKEAAGKGFFVSIADISYQKNELLPQIAAAGKGRYFNLSDNINQLAEFIKKSENEHFEQSQNLTAVWEDAGYYLLFVPLLCVLLLFRRGILSAFVLISLLAANNAYAGFFLNKNQEALQQFENKNYEEAAQNFDDAQWQASALYKAEKFDEAYQKFSADNSVTGLYNQGNALAKGGKIEDAIKKYEEVLQKEPDHEDAKFNLEYLKQQQNSSSSSSQNNDENQDDKNNSQNSQSSSDEQNQDENQQESKGQGSDDKNRDEQKQEQSSSQQQAQSEQPPEKQSSDDDKQSSSGSEGQETSGEKDKQQNRNSQPQSQSQSDEQPENDNLQNSPSASLQNEKQDTTSEEVMARARQYQEIEADPGGLLRAFIESEYRKNRYKE